MPKKTYIPQLRFIVQQAHNYGSRWSDQLEANLTTDQFTCFVTWLSASLALLACLGARPKE